MQWNHFCAGWLHTVAPVRINDKEETVISRRDFLKFQALLGGSALIPSLLSKSAYAGQGIHDLLQCKGTSIALPPPFQEPLPIPPVLNPVSSGSEDVYILQVRDAVANILPTGYPATPAWGFNGMMLGPTLRVRRNHPAVVYMQNKLSHDPVSIHLHGSLSPADSDGHPEDLIAPNTTKTYIYPNAQPPATLWYHDHRIHLTADQVYAGLAGFYLLVDEEIENELNLPKGPYDIPLVIQTRKLNADGSLCFSHNSVGSGGEVTMVNGKYLPYLNVARRKYRFRILNGDNSSRLQLGVYKYNYYGNGYYPLEYFVIATDTGYLQTPFRYPFTTSNNNVVPYFWMSPAERVEIVVDFSQLKIGERASLALGSRGYVEFRVTHDAVDDSDLPAVLDPSYVTLTQADVTDNLKSRRVNLEVDISNNMLWTIDGIPFGGAEPGQPYGSGFKHISDIKAGSIERWWFIMGSGWFMPHPMHVHTCRFQVTRRFMTDAGDPRVDYANPKAAEIPQEKWYQSFSNPWEQHAWKDTTTVYTNPGYTVEALVQFSQHPGTYVYHCHNLNHEDHDMMANMQLV